MELGQKLRAARLEAGLTQKQLCEDVVTRNMLSQIENGSAKPSMKTLQIFAQRLGKNVSFFLEETAVLSPNQQVMEEARSHFDGGSFQKTLGTLEAYREPDPVYDREKQLLEVISLLHLAESAIKTGKEGYARELLKKAEADTAYCMEELNRRRLLLRGKLRGEQVGNRLPSLDEELMLRAEEAQKTGSGKRAAQLLDACENQENHRWNLLRGIVWIEEKSFEQAKKCFRIAECAYPEETAPYLEICFRELGDYRQAYEYACKQRK